MKFFLVGSPPPYEHFVRLYRTLPRWDGYEYQDGDGYFRVTRLFLECLGVHELPVSGGRGVMEIEIQIDPRSINWIVGGSTLVKSCESIEKLSNS